MSIVNATQRPSARRVDLSFEVVVILVSDVDHAKRFYEGTSDSFQSS